MEAAFNLIEGLFQNQMMRAQLVWLGVAGFFFLLGLLFIGFAIAYRMGGEKVRLEVINLHVETSTLSPAEVAQAVGEGQYVGAVKPEFEILDGPYAGQILKSSSAHAPPVHNIGETVQGYFFPKSKTVMSRKESRSNVLFGAVFIGAGLCIAGFGPFMSEAWL